MSRCHGNGCGGALCTGLLCKVHLLHQAFLLSVIKSDASVANHKPAALMARFFAGALFASETVQHNNRDLGYVRLLYCVDTLPELFQLNQEVWQVCHVGLGKKLFRFCCLLVLDLLLLIFPFRALPLQSGRSVSLYCYVQD